MNKGVAIIHSVRSLILIATLVGLFACGILARGWLAKNETEKVDNFLLLTIILSLVWSVDRIALFGAFIGAITKNKYTVAKVARDIVRTLILIATFVGLFACGILARGWLAKNETEKVDNFILLTIIVSLVCSVDRIALFGAFIGAITKK